MKKRIVLVIGLAVLTGVAVIAFLFIRQLRSAPIPLGAPSGELAFMSDSNGSWDIFVMDSDGDVRNLTPDGDVPDYFPSWSFEGDFINFLTVRTGELGPGQVRPDGSGYRTLSITEAVMALFLEGGWTGTRRGCPAAGACCGHRCAISTWRFTRRVATARTAPV